MQEGRPGLRMSFSGWGLGGSAQGAQGEAGVGLGKAGRETSVSKEPRVRDLQLGQDGDREGRRWDLRLL